LKERGEEGASVADLKNESKLASWKERDTGEKEGGRAIAA